MKTSVIFSLTCILFFSLFSCSNNEEKNENQNLNNTITQTDVDTSKTVSERGMRSRYVMFNYANTSELEAQIPQALTDIANANLFELNNNTVSNCVRISSKVKIANGQALFFEYRYMDINNNTLELYQYDINTDEYIRELNPVPYNEPADSGGCPEGQEWIGSCGYGDGLSNCIASFSTTYIMNGLAGDNAVIVTVTNTLNFVRLCGEKIK